MVSSISDLWIQRLVVSPQTHLRLFCFPYAGSGASVFHSWPGRLKADVEIYAVQLPGRENRFLDPPFVRLQPLVEKLARVLHPYLDRPFAFFGHSMGALISFELARQLRKQRGPQPAYLFVSGHRAPHLQDRRPPIHHLPDAFLVEKLRRLNGTPEEVLEHAELLQLLLPVLRADLAICETYVHTIEEPLDLPVFAIGGLQDPEVSRDELAAWQSHTRDSFTLQMAPGGHFYIHYAQPLLLDYLSQILIKLIGD